VLVPSVPSGRRIALPKGQQSAADDPVPAPGKRNAQQVTPDSSNKKVCGTAGDDAVVLDMHLAMDQDISHKYVLKMIIKSKLFPLVKFITEGSTDMQFSASEGICAFLLNHCNVVGNHRMWWQSYQRVVRRIVNDHRNNKIKCIQNAYYGKLYTTQYDPGMQGPSLTHIASIESETRVNT
jgi:hypothetical protein